MCSSQVAQSFAFHHIPGSVGSANYPSVRASQPSLGSSRSGHSQMLFSPSPSACLPSSPCPSCFRAALNLNSVGSYSLCYAETAHLLVAVDSSQIVSPPDHSR